MQCFQGLWVSGSTYIETGGEKMTLAQRVEELVIASGTDSKRIIGEFVLQKKSRICDFTTQQIAKETYTSKSALVRFAKTLGFSGWSEFAREYASEQHYQETHYTDVDPNLPFHEDSSTKDIISLMCSLQMESLMDTADLISPQTIDRIVSLMERSKRIGLFGMSPNSLLGELFRRRMLTIGRNVEIPALGDNGLLASSLDSSDCAIIISYSGNSRTCEPLNTLRFLEPNGVPVIGITSRGTNYLRQHAAYTLSISSQEKLFSKISTFATETSINYLLNVLFSVYFARNYEKNLADKVEKGKILEYQRFSHLSELKEETSQA